MSRLAKGFAIACTVMLIVAGFVLLILWGIDSRQDCKDAGGVWIRDAGCYDIADLEIVP